MAPKTPAYRYGMTVAIMLTVTSIFAGYSILAHSALSGTLHPLVFALARDTLGTICLFTALYFTTAKGKSMTPTTEELPRLIMCGVCGVWCSQAGSAMALKNLDATTLSLLQPLLPIVTAIGSLVVGYEVWSVRSKSAWGKVLGLCLSVGGACYISYVAATNSSSGSGSKNLPVGLIFIGIQVSGGGLYSVVQKPLLNTRSSLFVASWGYALGWCILLLCTLSGATDPQDWDFTPKAVGAVVFSGILGSAFCYGAMAYAIQISHPLFMAAFYPFQPLATVVLVWATGGGLPSLRTSVGGAVCAGGLALFTLGEACKVWEEGGGRGGEGEQEIEDGGHLQEAELPLLLAGAAGAGVVGTVEESS